MRAELIVVGGVYRNRRAGTTLRKVLGIGVQSDPDVYYYKRESSSDVVGVLYRKVNARGEEVGDVFVLSLKSFSGWAGSRVL